MPMRRLSNLSIRTQIVFMLGSVAFITGVVSWLLLNGALPQAGGDPERLANTIAVVVALGAICTVVAAFAAGVYLDSAIHRSISTMKDATDQIAAGRFAHRIRSSRRDDLGALSHSIDAMASQLEQLERARQEFIASVSHDLRTPLTVARGYAFTLARHERDERRLSRLRQIETEIDRVASMVDDLMTASVLRVRPLTVQRRATDIRDVIQAAVRRFSDRAASAGVTFAVSMPRAETLALVDADRIQQILGNLIDNAIRHCDSGSAIEVTAHGRRGVIRVSVANHGEPVTQAAAATMFESFRQGRNPGSSGLGLSIASELANSHGSTMRVRCDGRRITFWFDLDQLAHEAQQPARVPRFAT
jgi:signal transduction histidine kinase